jgi:hypothetical protein
LELPLLLLLLLLSGKLPDPDEEEEVAENAKGEMAEKTPHDSDRDEERKGLWRAASPSAAEGNESSSIGAAAVGQLVPATDPTASMAAAAALEFSTLSGMDSLRDLEGR